MVLLFLIAQYNFGVICYTMDIFRPLDKFLYIFSCFYFSPFAEILLKVHNFVGNT